MFTFETMTGKPLKMISDIAALLEGEVMFEREAEAAFLVNIEGQPSVVIIDDAQKAGGSRKVLDGWLTCFPFRCTSIPTLARPSQRSNPPRRDSLNFTSRCKIRNTARSV